MAKGTPFLELAGVRLFADSQSRYWKWCSTNEANRKKVHVYKDKWPIELNGLLRRNDLTLITLVQHFSVKLVGQSLFALSQRKCPLKQCDLHSAMNICFP